MNDFYTLMFVDTETTGTCSMRTPYNEETLKTTWPYLTQVAWTIVKYKADLSESVLQDKVSFLIAPEFDESQYPQEVINKTGITMEMLNEKGIPSKTVLRHFFEDLKQVDAVVAHNATFDMKMIKAEALRLGWDNHMRICPWIDTCYYGYQLCKGRQANGAAKYPTLTELFEKVTGHIQDSAHQADVDVETLIVAFNGLCKIPTTDKYGHTGPVMTQSRLQAILDKHKSTAV